MSSMTYPRRGDTVDGVPPIAEAGATASGVSWPAIFGGAFAAAAVSLILLILGSALGLSAISPWSAPESVASFTVKTAIWLIAMQWIASGVGGYLSGRLRTKWTGLHTEEVFFRDTAHGFLAWCAATLLTATVLASTAAAVIGAGTHGAAMVASGAAAGASANATPAGPHAGAPGDMTGYYIDTLFRPSSVNAGAPAVDSSSSNGLPGAQDTRGETTRILAMSVKNGSLSDSDRAYLAQLVAARTGLSSDDAAKRVDAVLAQWNTAKEKAREDAETARKTAMHVSLYIFLSMLVGAFIASASGAVGGRHRDEY